MNVNPKTTLYDKWHKAMGDAILALNKALKATEDGDPGKAVFIARRACRHLDKAVIANRRANARG